MEVENTGDKEREIKRDIEKDTEKKIKVKEDVKLVYLQYLPSLIPFAVQLLDSQWPRGVVAR